MDFNSCKMKLFVVGCVLVAYFVHALVANQKGKPQRFPTLDQVDFSEGCSFSAHGRSGKNSPIFLQNDTLIVPTNGNINLKPRETITVACPDRKNYLIGTQSNTSQARCLRGKVLRVANQDVSLGDLQCHRVVRGMVSKTTRKCGKDKGRIYRIGYQISPRHFSTLIDVCYDSNVGSVLYTEHLLHGEDIRYASKSNYRPAFSPEASAVSASVAYKQAFQKGVFGKLLKSARLAQKYINESSFLARGHLSPDADFLFAATQHTTYYHINVSPQWQAINGGNWKKIEMLVRKLGDGLRETLTIVTGTYGVLTLPDVNGKGVKINLVSGDRLPVPQFIWKIVYSKQSKRAIVLVSLNNPFVKGVSERDYLCPDVCSKTRWSSASWSDYQRGFVYCCDYKQFTAEVETAPKLQVGGVLQGPK